VLYYGCLLALLLLVLAVGLVVLRRQARGGPRAR
jgi:hypothetical protein